jgi:hypothetical protein
MDVITDPLNMGMGGVALMVDAPSATSWDVIALPKRVASAGGIKLIKYFAGQQVAPANPKRMEFARYMVELEFANWMDVQGINFNPACANIISKTHFFALQSMKMQWGGKMFSAIQWRTTSAI